jgi:hypothetical protein
MADNRVFLALVALLALAACDPKVETSLGFFQAGDKVTMRFDGSEGMVARALCARHDKPNCYYEVRFSAEGGRIRVFGPELKGWDAETEQGRVNE